MLKVPVVAAIAISGAIAMAAANNDEPAFRFSAAIEIASHAAFVQLPLSPDAYAHSVATGLQDLRIVDGNGERVPFALLAPRAAETKQVPRETEATLYPLPARPAADGVWALPLQIRIQGDRIDIQPRPSPSTAPATSSAARSAGWLLDLGERERDTPPPQSLRMQWSGPAEFSAAFRFELSDDLRQWWPGGAGQLMSLQSANGALTQPTVVLPQRSGRFVRLIWLDADNAPAISGAKVVSATPRSEVIDPPSELSFKPGPEPPGTAAADDDARRALHFDLGGVLPIAQIDLRWDSGTRVVPSRVQARDRTDQAWRELGPAVFYRLERGAEVSHSPPIALQTSARYLRVLPDPRAAALDAASTQLVVQAPLTSLVFATQGQAPYRLLAGAEKAPPSALPIATLVPALDDERARFGRASLGPWREVEAVARAVESQRQRAALRPWLLWSVLLAGVAALAFMVWRLARGARRAQG
jgi:hypothetical protein